MFVRMLLLFRTIFMVTNYAVEIEFEHLFLRTLPH